MIMTLVALAQVLTSGRAVTTVDSSFLSLVPTLVKTAVDDARRSLPPGAGQGPLLIDLESFTVHGSMTVDREFSSDTVAARVGQPFREVGRAEAIRCDFEEGALVPRTCSIADDGLHLELQCISRTESGFQAVIMYRWTKRSLSRPSTIGTRVLRAWFARHDGAWQATKLKVVLAT
jgi:hypothetical protein